jgi:DNA-binding NarL/FixJ family response regulator
VENGAHLVNGVGSQRAWPGWTTVALIDDQALIRSAVRTALSAAGVKVVGEADRPEAVLRTVLSLRPDVVLMDFVFDGTVRIESIEQISFAAPSSRILVLTANNERERLLEAVMAGASGYILKHADAETIVNGVRASAAGECVIASEVAGGLLDGIREQRIRVSARGERAADAICAALTERELEIFTRLPRGETNREIGSVLSLSANTVKKHVASILAKLQLENRIQAAVVAVRSGFSCVGGLFLVHSLSEETELPGAVLHLLVGV